MAVFHRTLRDKQRSSLNETRMTWAKTSVRHSIQSTRLFLKKNLWAWPIVAVLVLSVVGFSIRSAIESTMRSSVLSQLQTLLDVEVAMLQSWLKVQQSNAEAVANSNETQNFVKQLLEAVDPTNPMPQQTERERERTFL